MRRPAGNSRGADTGFTILEVVLAMGIMVLGMSALLSLLTFGAALTRAASLRTTAATAIEAVVTDLEESLFPLEPDGSVGEPRPIVERPVPGARGVVYSARTEVNPDEPLEYLVDVEVSWDSSGVRRVRTFQTLLLREVPFGERMRRRFVEQRPAQLPGEVGPGGMDRATETVKD